MITAIKNILFNESNNFKYSNYTEVLEYLPENNNLIQNLNIKHDLLIQSISKYLQNYSKINNDKILVSLSGGVDSMVLITIIKFLNYDVIALHINYNNRDESLLEQNFIEEWCKYNSILLYVKSIQSMRRGEIKRSDYENETRIIRYNFYKEIINKENTNAIMLAHHKDDIIENIFANFCRGRNLLDLPAISDIKEIDGVKIIRPMLDHFKYEIYNFSKIYNVPYFKDTTPDWSIRGKYRNKIFPIILNTFSSNIKNNLLKISEQSKDWNFIINKDIINPFMQKIKFNDKGCVFNIEENYITYPITFWNIIFQNIFYKFGKSSPSKKGITSFMNNIQTKNVSFISISNSCICRNKNYEITITFSF